MPRNPRLKSGNQKLKDKMLSAEKVRKWLYTRKTYCPTYGVELKLNALILELIGAIDCGQLDADCPTGKQYVSGKQVMREHGADRPNCLRCRDTGVKIIHGDLGGPSFRVACDCPAGTGGSEK